MIPLAEPNLTGNELRYLTECVESGYVSTVGRFVGRLEDLAAAAAGAPRAVATASGTAGLHVSLVALGVRPGDLVILPSYTFVASANAIAQCGAEPWLIDIAADSLTLDPEALAGELADHVERRRDGLIHRPTGRRVAAILPVHALGQPADMDPIVDLARESELPVLADGAAALGAHYRDRLLGEFGADLTVVSFNGNKTFTAGGGGMVLGDDATLTERVRHLSTTARIGPGYDHDAVGYNYRMTNLQAAVGCAQMERLGAFLAVKRRLQADYEAALADVPGLSPLPCPDGRDSACWLSALVLDPEVDADAVRAGLQARGIDSRPFWRPIHQQAPYEKAPRGTMGVCEALWPRVLVLPCSTHLSTEEQRTVVEAVKEVMT